MRLKLLPIGVLVFSLAGPCWAQTQPEIRQFSQGELESLGRQMFDQDEEAGRATDILFAQKDQKTLQEEKVRGWIVDPSLVSAKVRFVRDGEVGLEAAYDIEFVQDRTPHISIPTDRTLTGDEKAQFAARDLAMKNIERPCSDRYNTIALKDPEGEGWLIWAIAATSDPKISVVGGHYRFTVSRDGQSIVQRDALSRGCLSMPKPEDGPKGKAVAEATVQLVSNVPVETTVFHSFQLKLPEIVITPDKNVWGIENGKMRIIRKLDDLPTKQH